MNEIIDEINNSGLIDEIATFDNILEILPIYESLLNCKDCMGLDCCKNPTKGYQVTKRGYKRCKFLTNEIEKEKSDNNLESLFLSKKSLEASLSNFDIDNESRRIALATAMNIINNKKTKGMFVSGKNRVGKTYFLSAIANEYKYRGNSVIIAFLPDLIRYLRTIKFQLEIEDIINKLKNVDVLILDDLGMEIFDPWFSTEIITPILNYRLQEKKNTFFSSNYTIDELTKLSPKDRTQEYIRLFRRIFSLVEKCQNKYYFEIEEWDLWNYLLYQIYMEAAIIVKS